jgi:hypothetical protein
MKVSQFHVKNQFIITDDNRNQVFQSYDSIICRRDADGTVTLDDKYWDYSKTTGKYRNMFLDEKKSETEKKIKSGEYKLANLN